MCKLYLIIVFYRDPFYTYPKYDEEIYNRRHYPNEYCKDYDRSKNDIKKWSWIHVVLMNEFGCPNFFFKS
jgi:hypothetical protein